MEVTCIIGNCILNDDEQILFYGSPYLMDNIASVSTAHS